MKVFSLSALSVVLAIGAVAASAQDVVKGMAEAEAAYKAGDVTAAFNDWLFWAQKGNANAQYNVAESYRVGEGVVQNFAEAAKFYEAAALQGLPDAMTHMGFVYRDGIGVVQDYTEALKWFRSAIESGDKISVQVGLDSIGIMYRDGQGVLQDNIRAHMWLNIASANGWDGAREWRDKLATQMTKEDVSKAQAMAQLCMSSSYKDCGW